MAIIDESLMNNAAKLEWMQRATKKAQLEKLASFLRARPKNGRSPALSRASMELAG
ncbi:MAG TPA: hypothetical protein VLQ65_10520 [Saliniramus sp.]|nr:hypothetical protein [Saliniramus sp.]